MILVAHRRNTVDLLRATPSDLGVEMDVRTRGDRLVVTHDPFTDGPDLDVWLRAWSHRLLIVNTKEEGLEERIEAVLAAAGVQDWFFLDQTFPFLMRTLRRGQDRVAVRVSDYEHPGTAMALAGRARWVWLDGFHGFPVADEVVAALRGAGYRICLVSPELHGRDPGEIDAWRGRAQALGLFDAGDAVAVCTRHPERWVPVSS